MTIIQQVLYKNLDIPYKTSVFDVNFTHSGVFLLSIWESKSSVWLNDITQNLERNLSSTHQIIRKGWVKHH